MEGSEARYGIPDGLAYALPGKRRQRKVEPPLLVVMNERCTGCSGSPCCAAQCPVDCIHLVYEQGRPVRVWVDNASCVGCLHCLSYELRPRDVVKGGLAAGCAALNAQDPFAKAAVCPWDAIEVLPFADGVLRSARFYPQAHRGEGEAPGPSAPTAREYV